MSPPGPGRPLLLAAVVLSAGVGLVGGASAAWAIYHHYGPVDTVASPALVGPATNTGQRGIDAPTYGSLAATAAASLVTIETHPTTAADLAAGTARFGTGFVASSDGLVVTSAHALAGATRLRLAYPDGEVVDATVAGSDTAHGLAVLRPAQAPQTRPPALPFADFQQRAPRAGDLVLAVGSRPLDGVSVTAGTITATGCGVAGGVAGPGALLGTLAIDATGSPDDDGAPLLDGSGRVVGVVADTGTAGVVALDGRSAADLVSALGRGATKARPGFGVTACQLDAAHAGAVGTRPGALVMSVTPGGPADISGMRPGDVVTAVGATSVDAEHPLDALALGLNSGQQVRLTVVRAGQEQAVSLTVI